MPSPFPGMDPYLENPELWSEVHSRLIVAIADALSPAVRPKYRVAIEKRMYLINVEEGRSLEIPDVTVISKQPSTPPKTSTLTVPASEKAEIVRLPMPEIVRESYLEIREVGSGSVVTVVEVLSPTNKRGKGREAYQEKREELLATPTNLVEIDLLRGGVAMPILGEVSPTDYRILVYRRRHRPFALLYGFNLRDEIPKFLLPLRPGDEEPEVDLQNLMAQMYERAGFDAAADYGGEPVPRFKKEDREWVEELLRGKGWR